MIYTLKRILENTERFFSDLYQSMLSLLKVIILSKFNIRYPSNDKEECLILGNGPSLRVVIDNQSEYLKKSVLFCVNNFPTFPEYQQLKPQNCVFLDPGFYLKDEKSTNPILIQTIENIVAKTDWPMNLFIPSLAKNANHLTSISKRNSNVRICFYNYTVVKGFTFFRHILFKKNLGMPLCQNVLGACIYLALNRGFKKVYLLGADHTWAQSLMVGEDNELSMKHSHFYTEEGKPLITNIYKSPLTKEKMLISEYFKACSLVFEAYYILNTYAKTLNSKIFNATEGSFIDAFERRKL